VFDGAMSKAFTKENDDAPEEEAEDIVAPALPSGAKNYITPQGFDRLRMELKQLRSVERPKTVEVVSWAAGNGDRSENGDYIYGKKRLREIDRRMRYLMKRLEIAEVVDPGKSPHTDQIFFGATVTYVDVDDEAEEEKTIRIVGVDETDTANGEISWVSPIARAFLKAQTGDVVDLMTPAGTRHLEVVAVIYR
jgi:transcription elongation factor GreB